MKRALAGALLALAVCAGSTGRASGDTFKVVQDSASYEIIGSRGLPSAQIPNSPGSLVLPPNWTRSASTTAVISSDELRALWQSAGQGYGIPWPVLAAINKIESNFGRNMGPSSAGAVGWMQFMPSTWLRWGADFDGDGVADPWNPTDAVYSAARYLAAAGGTTDVPRSIFAYNHAQWYVDEVLAVAKLFEGDASLAISLDGLQADLEQAEEKVSQLSEKISGVRTRVRKIRTRAEKMFQAAELLPLVNERAAARSRAAALDAEASALGSRLPALLDSLAQAEQELEEARSSSETGSFAPGTSVYLSGPLYQNGYVFPVGGGPSKVAVGHNHHDYPAADIAAPTGAPLYALADGVVEKAWSTIDPLCGIGMRYRTDDGRTWSYCHLSYIEPQVVAGARLTAGARVGLVGSTGHSTGPHLHLGLLPSSLGYPQNEAWFQGFAGIAFRWKDAPTPELSFDPVALGSSIEFAVLSGGGGGSWDVAPAEPAPPPASPSAGSETIVETPFLSPPADS